jgi:hypothetical protein
MPAVRHKRIATWLVILTVIGAAAEVVWIEFRTPRMQPRKIPTTAEYLAEHPSPQPASPAQMAAFAQRARERRDDNHQQQEADVAHVLSSSKRTSPLPNWVARVYVDPSGRAWFQDNPIGEDDASIRKSIEDAFAGKSRIVRAKLWLVDSRRRFWVSLGEGPPKSILCFDGLDWSEHPIPTGAEHDMIDLYPRGWEDSVGNAWFVILNRSINVCWVDRCDAQGQWLHTTVPNDTGREKGLFWEQPVLTESPRGTPAFYSARVDPSEVDYSSMLPRVFRFVNGQWRGTTARVCWDHPTDYVMPLSDGRVLTICEDRKLFVYDAPPQEKLTALMSNLDDPEPAVRESAMARLSLVSADEIDMIRKGQTNAKTPAGQAALGELIEQLDQQKKSALGPRGPAHPPTMQCDGFSFSAVRYVGTDPNGKFVLDVDDYREDSNPKVIRRALVVYAPDGSRTMTPLPPDWPADMFGSNSLRDDILVARDGSIWFRDGRRYKDGKITTELPEFLGRGIKQDDADGHLFCGNRMVINLRVAQSESSAK